MEALTSREETMVALAMCEEISRREETIKVLGAAPYLLRNIEDAKSVLKKLGRYSLLESFNEVKAEKEA